MAWNPRKRGSGGSSWNEPQEVETSWLKPVPLESKWLNPKPLKTTSLSPASLEEPAQIADAQQADLASTACSDSDQCASGWICAGGVCVEQAAPAGGSTVPTTLSPSFQNAYPGYQPPNGQSSGGNYVPSSSGSSNTPVGARYPRVTGSGRGSGSISGCGEEYYVDPDGNYIKTPCEPDPGDNGCRKSGCGPDRFNASDCCGEERCCRYSANGAGVTVGCSCGPCEDPSNKCNSFCSNFRAANGVLSPGCDNQKICDECSDCVSTPGGPPGTSCQPKLIGTSPCQCEESSCGAQCDRCDSDGICRTDCDKCVVPYPTYARCACGDFRTTSYVNACGERWAEAVDCSQLCQDEPDECEGACTSVSWCGGQSAPPCPTGSVCSVTGTVSAGGKTCYLRTDCNKLNVPEKCKECDCNCEDDCPDCKICDASGKCVDDPLCEEARYRVLLQNHFAGALICASRCYTDSWFGKPDTCDCVSCKPITDRSFFADGEYKLPVNWVLEEPISLPFYIPQGNCGPTRQLQYDNRGTSDDNRPEVGRWSLYDADGKLVISTGYALHGQVGLTCYGEDLSLQASAPMFKIVGYSGPGLPPLEANPGCGLFTCNETTYPNGTGNCRFNN